VRKTAVLLGGVLAVGGAGAFSARALATHATVAVDPGPPPCVAVSVAIDGTPVNVDQKHCAPASAPELPSPAVPSLSAPADVPALPLPKVDVPSVTVPDLNLPPAPSLPSLPAPALPSVTLPAAPTETAALCNYDPARPTPPPASEESVTLPDGTTLFRNLTVDPSTMTVSGYLGGANPLIGTLEGGGTASPAGVTGQIDGNNVQTGLSGYLGTSGYCLGK
jgi:hypothetical protein